MSGALRLVELSTAIGRSNWSTTFPAASLSRQVSLPLSPPGFQFCRRIFTSGAVRVKTFEGCPLAISTVTSGVAGHCFRALAGLAGLGSGVQVVSTPVLGSTSVMSVSTWMSAIWMGRVIFTPLASQLWVVTPLIRSGRTQSAGTLKVAVSQLPDALVWMSQPRYPPLTWSRPQPSETPNLRA